MLNETTLLDNLQIALGSKLFECLPLEWYMRILNTKSLYLFSSFYPKIIKGIRMTQNCAIPTIDPATGMQQFHRYIIPKYNPEDEYIGIEKYIFNGQGYDQVYNGFNSPMADAAMAKVRSLQNYPSVRWRAEFEAPNFCEVYPYRWNHIDFVLNMQRMTRLNEIAFGYHESFIELFTADVKKAIYREFPAARENGGIINGIEINTDISNFDSEGDSVRKEVIDVFKDDWALDPSRFDALLSQS